MKRKNQFASGFETFSNAVTRYTGSTGAFITAVLLVLIWAITGPIFHYSETWQLVINTGTTIITFLMVFLIQKSQNKESMAVQLKLNELLAANRNTSNRMVNIEDLTEAELNTLRQFYCQLAELAKKDNNLHQSHSIDEALDNHQEKKLSRKQEEAREEQPWQQAQKPSGSAAG